MPATFLFMDSRAVRFEIPAERGRLPEDQAATMLAMNCLTHSRLPEDYELAIVLQRDTLETVRLRAAELIETAHGMRPAVTLTARQKEVLRGIVDHLGNKDIASRLNLTERTIKFHVSSLLEKFRVTDRHAVRSAALEIMAGELQIRKAL